MRSCSLLRIHRILAVSHLLVSDILVGSVACAPAVYSVFTGYWPFGVVWCQISGVVHGVSCAPAVYSVFTGYWPFGAVWCQIAGVVHGVSCAMSGWCISMVGIDRYIAIIWPFRYNQMMSKRNTVIIMTTLWLCAFASFVAPIFTKENYVYYKFTQELRMCGLYWEYPLYCLITTLYMPVVDSVVIVFTGYRINRSLNRYRVPRANANRKALRKLVASGVAFFVCWAPYVNLVTISSFMPAFRPSPLLRFWTLWLGNCNSFITFVCLLCHSQVLPTRICPSVEVQEFDHKSGPTGSGRPPIASSDV